MTKLTTGVAFLMSSLYGSGMANTQVNMVANSATAVDRENVVATVQAVSTTNPLLADSTDPKQIRAYVESEYADTPLLVDVARCESEFRQFDRGGNIVRGRVNKSDVGIMQINEKYHADEAVKMGFNIYTVQGNVAFGKYLYSKYGAQPWSSSAPCWSQPSNDLATNAGTKGI